MLFRPHLRLLRGRLIAAAVFALGIVLIEFMATASDDLSLGAFWHQACTCPVDPSDVRILLTLALDFVFVAGIMGYMSGMGKNSASYPQPSALRFMLTRPQSRLDLVLAPFLIAATAIILLPGLAWLLLIGWLYLVHAPSLGHLVAVLETIPAASQLGPHPSFPALAAGHPSGPVLSRWNLRRAMCLYLSQLQPLADAKPFHFHKNCWFVQFRLRVPVDVCHTVCLDALAAFLSAPLRRLSPTSHHRSRSLSILHSSLPGSMALSGSSATSNSNPSTPCHLDGSPRTSRPSSQ